MSKEELVLLDLRRSPFCMRVKIALGEKGLDYETREEEDLFGKKSELLIKSNPIYKKVPVLLHNGNPLCESTVILGYIDEKWPTPPLLPTCAYERAQARFWADYVDKKLLEAASNIMKRGGRSVEEVKEELVQALKVLEAALGEKEFFGGDTFGYSDIVAITLAFYFLATERPGDYKCDTECPKLSAWANRCRERESVAKIIQEAENLTASEAKKNSSSK